jgi:UDP-N-acetylglucosamine acyltransferase
MTLIDPTARIDESAEIGSDTIIGPFCIIGPGVVIGASCRLVAHVHVAARTTIGQRTTVYPFASLGTPPQSVKYRGGPTQLVVGSDCDIREGVTMNTGTEDGGGVTRVGNRCFLMANSHVGHDCSVGDGVTFANNAVLGGHVVVGDNVFFGGQSAVHQFVRIGEGAMVSGLSGAVQDVIPFGFVFGAPVASLAGLNVIGLKRRGFSRADIHRLRSAYRLLFYGEGRFADRVEAVAGEFADDQVVGKIVAFLRQGGSRPVMKARPRESGAGADPAD